MDFVLPPDFKEFFSLLHSHGVEYLLIGGYAVGYHGYPRATGDLDIWVAQSPSNAERLVAVLQEFGFATPELKSELFLQEHSMVRLGMAPLRIEIITVISGVNFEECYAARIFGLIDGVQISVISLAHLRQNKQASGRPKDLNDLRHLP
jgi:hypothetical protein